jgi:hypothetical protein
MPHLHIGLITQEDPRTPAGLVGGRKGAERIFLACRETNKLARGGDMGAVGLRFGSFSG